MNEQIQMNSVEYMAATGMVQTSADGISVDLETWSSQGESSSALEAFAQQYLELEKTMKLFQTLLHQDVKTMNSIGLKFLVTDLNIAKLW